MNSIGVIYNWNFSYFYLDESITCDWSRAGYTVPMKFKEFIILQIKEVLMRIINSKKKKKKKLWRQNVKKNVIQFMWKIKICEVI